jgi:hypothetical protein
MTVGTTTVTGVSQALTVSLPFARFVWNRPTDIRVENEGQTGRVRVMDVTRLAQLAFYGLAIAAMIVELIARQRISRRAIRSGA